MPASSKRDEEEGQKASSATRVASRWLIARGGGDWEQFMQEMYEGGKMLVRNTNQDTKKKFPKVEAETLLKTDRKFNKLLRGQFERWKGQNEKKGPQGELVESVDQLEKGQTLTWMSRKDKMRGTVDKVRGNRAIIKLDDGRTIHMRPSDVEQLQPRVVG